MPIVNILTEHPVAVEKDTAINEDIYCILCSVCNLRNLCNQTNRLVLSSTLN